MWPDDRRQSQANNETKTTKQMLEKNPEIGWNVNEQQCAVYSALSCFNINKLSVKHHILRLLPVSAQKLFLVDCN